MIDGLFLDPRAWNIDFHPSPSWHPEKYGLKIDLHNDAFQIANGLGVPSNYKFVIVCEVWEIPMRKTLKYLREKGLKIFLAPREPFKTDVLKASMFSYSKFLWEGQYYFKPDMLLASGKAYADMWGNASDTAITGYPRFDWWQYRNWDVKAIKTKYGIEQDKKIIFFPSYPPVHYKRVGLEDTIVDIYAEQEETLAALESFVNTHKDYQAIIKVHPVAWKSHLKGNGFKKSVTGLMKKYLDNPTSNIKVIGDDRNSGLIAKELLIASDLVVGFTSTMLLEAGMINKPSIHILFGVTKDIEGLPDYCKHLPTAYNTKELHEMILSDKTGSMPISFIEHYLYLQDGRAADRICKEIANYMSTTVK